MTISYLILAPITITGFTNHNMPGFFFSNVDFSGLQLVGLTQHTTYTHDL